ncbi:MAG: cobalamin-dependent protein [Planctomycetota bacterium]|nr:cobalamin-dependent protein [Planctomycetota bacterium]
MRVTLVYPPNRNVPSSPYGALPLLAGCLGAAGHEVAIVDANLEVFDRLMEPGPLAGARATYDATWAELRALAAPTPEETERLQGLAKLGVVPFERLTEGAQAARVLRDPELFREPEAVNRAYDTIANVLRAAYCLNPVYMPLARDFTDELFGYVEGDFDNPISQLVEEHVIDQVLATKPDLVALTIPFNEQTVEAFALLKQLKRRAPDLPTMIGGAIVSAFHQRLCTDPRMYRYADFAMPGEADLSFPRFATDLERGQDLKGIPNLYHRDASGTIHPPAERSLPNLNEIASPDFAPVPVGRYLLPVTVINYQTSRGCYYGKCTFCSFDIKQNFRFRKAQLVTEDIERIQEQTGSRHFVFWDPLTPPRLMRDVAKWNRERGERMIFWGAETKFEKVFTDQAFTDLLYEGGARFLQFGYESGSQRVLDLMVKGNDLERVGLMLDAMKRSRIAVSVQWFIGFPGETEEEARQSFRYLDEHRDAVLLSSYMGTYTISPDDDVYESQGDLYDIDIHQRADGALDYRHRDGREHYDRDELNAAYLVRGDSETVTRMAFYIYLTEQPDRARELSGFERGGVMPDSWAELAGERPHLPSANFLRSWDFDVFTPQGREQAESSRGAFVTQTQTLHPLTKGELRLLGLADGSRTAAELVTAVAGANGRADLRERLLAFVRRGLLVVPRRAPQPV